ncbi:MAG: redoxin domain-containing protein [Acidobacteriota bacterium]
MSRLAPLRPTLACGILALLASATTVVAHGNSATHAHGAKAAASGDLTPEEVFEALMRQRRYPDMHDKAREFLTDKVVENDVVAKFWVGRALRAERKYDQARAQFQEVARRYPKHELGRTAKLESALPLIAQLKGSAKTKAEVDLATQAAAEFKAAAKELADDGDLASRALFLAGNAHRMCGQDAEAIKAYQDCAKVTTETDYPAKCLYGEGTVIARNFDGPKAQTLFSKCLADYPEGSYAKRCKKGIGRMKAVGDPAPEFNVETWIHDPKVTMSSLRGKVVIIFFFATWCPHCKAALPGFAEWKTKFGDKVQLIGMTANSRGQTTESAKLFVEDPQWDIDYPCAVDLGTKTSAAMAATGLPQIVLIDKKGVMRWIDHPNYLTESMIATLVKE